MAGQAEARSQGLPMGTAAHSPSSLRSIIRMMIRQLDQTEEEVLGHHQTPTWNAGIAGSGLTAMSKCQT